MHTGMNSDKSQPTKILDLSVTKTKRFDRDAALRILSQYQNCSTLEEINLFGCELGDNCLPLVAHLLGKNPGLHTIDLRHNKLSGKELGKFSQFIQNNFLLTSLNLEENQKLSQFDKSKEKVGADFFNEGILTQFNYNSNIDDGVGREKERFLSEKLYLETYCYQNNTNKKVFYFSCHLILNSIDFEQAM
jgi:hypothetical protein